VSSTPRRKSSAPYYEGLIARGKVPKVALIASMRKLLHAVYFVAKNRAAFVPRLEPAA